LELSIDAELFEDNIINDGSRNENLEAQSRSYTPVLVNYQKAGAN
jgi:hypothetical protein